MFSYVKQITDAVEAKIIFLLPTFTKSPYVWSIGNNNSKTNQKVFRVIADAGTSIDGAMRSITMDQKFTVYLSTSYINKNSNDTGLQDAIESLYASLEVITTEAMLRKFNINRVMSVSGLELSAPEIDHDNHIVSIGATYTMLYRME